MKLNGLDGDVQQRHGTIEDDEVRLKPARRLEEGPAIRHCTHDLALMSLRTPTRRMP